MHIGFSILDLSYDVASDKNNRYRYRKVIIVGKVDAKYTIREPLCNVDDILIASVF